MAAWGYEFYLSSLEEKFVSPRGHVISSIYLSNVFVGLEEENTKSNAKVDSILIVNVIVKQLTQAFSFSIIEL